MNEPTIRLPRRTHHLIQDIDRCKRLIRHYIKHDAYVEYDWLGSPGDHDIITCRQRKPINGIMRAHAPEEFWAYWRERRDRPPPELLDIPRDLDLVDDCDAEVERGIAAVFKLVSQMAAMKWVRDVAPTKALHLLRPRFVAISDSLVRPLLGIGETQIPRTYGGDSDAEWFADRAVAVQCAIRKLGQENRAVLDELHAYANEIAIGLLGERVAASKPPVKLSKARVLDIVLWSHARCANVG